MNNQIKKITTLGINLEDDHKKRLETIGELKELESPTSVEDFLKKTANTDVIYSDGDYLLESLSKLKNVFFEAAANRIPDRAKKIGIDKPFFSSNNSRMFIDSTKKSFLMISLNVYIVRASGYNGNV